MTFFLVYLFISSLLNIKMQKEFRELAIKNNREYASGFWYHFFVNALGILMSIPAYISKFIYYLFKREEVEDK